MPGYLNGGDWMATGGSIGWPGLEGKNDYAAAMLGKVSILIGRVQRRTVLVACTHYGGCGCCWQGGTKSQSATSFKMAVFL
jgi:hypothetical protein